MKKYPLKSRLHAWDLSKAQMVLRRLVMDRDQNLHEIMAEFVYSMHGKDYGLNPISMIRRVSVDKESFFCSEIVAMALKRIHVLQKRKARMRIYR